MCQRKSNEFLNARKTNANENVKQEWEYNKIKGNMYAKQHKFRLQYVGLWIFGWEWQRQTDMNLCVLCVVLRKLKLILTICIQSSKWFWFGLWLHKNCFISFNLMLNGGGAITSTNEMRSHSFNAHTAHSTQVWAHQMSKSFSAKEIDFERIFGSVRVCYSSEWGRRANKNRFCNQRSQKLMNWIPLLRMVNRQCFYRA